MIKLFWEELGSYEPCCFIPAPHSLHVGPKKPDLNCLGTLFSFLAWSLYLFTAAKWTTPNVEQQSFCNISRLYGSEIWEGFGWMVLLCGVDWDGYTRTLAGRWALEGPGWLHSCLAPWWRWFWGSPHLGPTTFPCGLRVFLSLLVISLAGWFNFLHGSLGLQEMEIKLPSL